MATCSKLPLLFILAVCAAATLPTAAAEDPPFEPVQDVNDSHIQQLGEWAVEQHVKQANDGLKFIKVVDGQFQYVMGRVNFKLLIDAWNGTEGTEGIHTATLYHDGWSNWRQLVSFV